MTQVRRQGPFFGFVSFNFKGKFQKTVFSFRHFFSVVRSSSSAGPYYDNTLSEFQWFFQWESHGFFRESNGFLKLDSQRSRSTCGKSHGFLVGNQVVFYGKSAVALSRCRLLRTLMWKIDFKSQEQELTIMGSMNNFAKFEPKSVANNYICWILGPRWIVRSNILGYFITISSYFHKYYLAWSPDMIV